MILFAGVCLSRPTRNYKNGIAKYISNGDLSGRITRESAVFSGKSSMHAWLQSWEQSKIRRDQMSYYGIHEVCDICVRKNKHGGRAVEGVWLLDFPFT